MPTLNDAERLQYAKMMLEDILAGHDAGRIAPLMRLLEWNYTAEELAILKENAIRMVFMRQDIDTRLAAYRANNPI